MKKLTITLMVASLVLGGVALAASADLHKASVGIDLSRLQKITDQEAQEIRGTGSGLGPQYMGNGGICPNPDCPQVTTSVLTSVSQPRTQLRTQTSYTSSPAGILQRPQDRTQGHWN